MILSECTNNRDNNFNLIRFIAASLVLYSHSYSVLIGTNETEPLWNSIGMTGGSIAVDVFFLTSGFLIAKSFFVRNNIVSFFWARMLRIYPALIVAVVFCVFIVGLFFTTNTLSEYFSHPETYKFFLENGTLVVGVHHYLPGVFAENPHKHIVNGPLWTLPWEGAMYVSLAIIASTLILIQKKLNENILELSFTCIAITAVSASIIVNYFQLISVSYMFRISSMFFVGATFYVNKKHIFLSLKLFSLILIILLLSAINKELFFIAYSISLAYLILYIAYIPSGNIRKFNNFGDYSYGIYIYAYPVQQSLVATVTNISVASMVLISFPITFVLAFLSWHIVEKKFLQMKGNYVLLEKNLQNIWFIRKTAKQ